LETAPVVVDPVPSVVVAPESLLELVIVDAAEPPLDPESVPMQVP
jgi:hypothetical protein